MTEKIIGWDAVQEMRKDPSVRYRYCGNEYSWSDGYLRVFSVGEGWLFSTISPGDLSADSWERVVEPLRDEDLAQAWERQASIAPIGSGYAESVALRRCAAQLRARKLDVEAKP